MAKAPRELEVVVWGASGFTGKLTAEYLLSRYGASGRLRWAIAGRNAAKLEAVRDELSRETRVDAHALPTLVGDGGDAAFLDQLTRRCRVVCSCVGPYAKYGSPLVAACARNGADYCDLTGEVHWMQRMIEAHQEAAAESGARIVFCCGFDCIPADLGAFFLQREMRARHGVACSRIQFRVAGFSGGASGGTIASMLAMLEEAERDPAVRAAMADPYALNPKGERAGPDGSEHTAPRWDPDFRQWTAPFMMAGIDTKVVRRTNALLGYAYGKDFRYDEAMLMGASPLGLARASLTSLGTSALMGTLALGPLRRVVSGQLPQPGEGPSRAKREAGYFDIRLRGEHPHDAAKSLRGRIRGDRDPGYGSTSKMLGESAVCLALDPLPAARGLLDARECDGRRSAGAPRRERRRHVRARGLVAPSPSSNSR